MTHEFAADEELLGEAATHEELAAMFVALCRPCDPDECAEMEYCFQ